MRKEPRTLRRKAGVVNRLDAVISLELLGKQPGILALPLDTQSERLHPAKYLMSFPNAHHAADQFHYSYQGGLVRLFIRNDDPAHRVGVTAKVLCCAMNAKIGTELQRPRKIGRCKCVVYDQSRTDAVCDLSRGRDVAYFQQRIRYRFGQKDPRLHLVD